MSKRAIHLGRLTATVLTLILSIGLAACGNDGTGPTGGPPVITSLNFPAVIPGVPGDTTPGTVRFSDPDGDIMRVYFEVVSAQLPFADFDFDPDILGDKQGSFEFNIWCDPTGNVCSGASVTLQVTLEDAKDHLSSPVSFTFTYQ